MELEILDMTCGHCAATITKAIQNIDADASVAIDLPAKTVRIDSGQLSSDIIAAIVEAGYSPSSRIRVLMASHHD